MKIKFQISNKFYIWLNGKIEKKIFIKKTKKIKIKINIRNKNKFIIERWNWKK